MSYLGNQPATGENNSFKILDDISTYTLTFDGSSASVVSTSNNTITYNNHRFITAQRVTYTDGSGSAIGGLSDGSVYYIIKSDQNTIKLAANASDANNDIEIPLTSLGTGTNHTINVAFDGVNTKFKATYDNGTKAQMSRAAQLTISMNGVIQQPQDTATPANGFGFDLDSVIVFSIAPTISDVFWGHLVANNFPTFDISDNTVDSFTGDNSTVTFTLSKPAVNNQNVLVTLDGVIQYPSDNYNIRAYSVYDYDLTFTSAPGSGVDIQVRHIGFAGATTSSVTGFYGRTGNAVLKTTDNILVGNINSSGIVTATTFDGSLSGEATSAITAGYATTAGIATVAQGLTGTPNIVVGVVTASSLSISGNVSIAGTLTYEDVTNIDSLGIITARTGIQVLAGGINAVGVVTATSFSGSGTGLTNVPYTSLTGVTTDIVGDTTPQLGGDLDVNNNDITGTGNINLTGIVTASGGFNLGISSAGTTITSGPVTSLNFIGAGNTFAVNGTTVDISIAGGAGAGGTWRTYTAGIATSKSVGVNTTNLDDPDLVGVGNSFQGLYVSNGMIIFDQTLSGNHYIGTNFSGLIAGPANIDGVLTIDGEYVVV